MVFFLFISRSLRRVWCVCLLLQNEFFSSGLECLQLVEIWHTRFKEMKGDEAKKKWGFKSRTSEWVQEEEEGAGWKNVVQRKVGSNAICALSGGHNVRARGSSSTSMNVKEQHCKCTRVLYCFKRARCHWTEHLQFKLYTHCSVGSSLPFFVFLK